MAASRRLCAICNGLKVPQEGSSASLPCPLFTQNAFSKVYPVIDGFTSRDSLDNGKKERSGLRWKSLVTDSTESGILERDRKIFGPEKKMKSCLPLQGYTRSEPRVTNSVRGLSGFWTSNPELDFLPLPKTGHFSLDFGEVLDHSRKCEYRLGFRSLFDLLISHSLLHSLLALTLVCFPEVQISDGLWELACKRLKSDFSMGSSRQ